MLLGVSHSENHGLLVDSDRRDRVAGAVEQIAALINVVTLFDTFADAFDEHVLAEQDRERCVPPELVSQCRRCHLAALKGCPVANISGGVRLVFLRAKLTKIA